jgi:hypothetical protein
MAAQSWRRPSRSPMAPWSGRGRGAGRGCWTKGDSRRSQSWPKTNTALKSQCGGAPHQTVHHCPQHTLRPAERRTGPSHRRGARDPGPDPRTAEGPDPRRGRPAAAGELGGVARSNWQADARPAVWLICFPFLGRRDHEAILQRNSPTGSCEMARLTLPSACCLCFSVMLSPRGRLNSGRAVCFLRI